jgi:hypothetical protein
MALLATKGMSRKTSSERQKGLKGSWGFAAGSFARELEQRKTLFYFWYTKGFILNPPNRDHGASINNALNEVLWVHGGPSWRIFQVRIFRWIRGLLPYPLCVCVFSDFACSRVLPAGDRSWRAELGRGTTASLN